MKEEADWTSVRQPPRGSTTSDGRSIIPDWASLPPELVQGIAYCVLSTTGLIVLGASDGLIVLGDRERLFVPRLLNPLTGDMLQFAAPLQEHFGVTSIMLVRMDRYSNLPRQQSRAIMSPSGVIMSSWS
jgi:hypothetical protein